MARLPRPTPHTVGTTENRLPSDYRNAGKVLWRWNEKDFSQFGTAIVSHTGTISLTLVAGGLDSDPRIGFNMSSFNGWAFWPILGLDLPRRFSFHAKAGDVSMLSSSSDNIVVLVETNIEEGLASGSLHGVQYSTDGGGTMYLIEAGTRVTTGVPGVNAFASGNADVGTSHYVDVLKNTDPNLSDPEYAIHFTGTNSGGVRGDATGSPLVTHTFAGSWGGLFLNKAGIGMSTSNTLSGTAELSELVFYRHRMDA